MKKLLVFCFFALLFFKTKTMDLDYFFSNKTLASLEIEKLKKNNPEFSVEILKKNPDETLLKITLKKFFEKNTCFFEEVQHEFITKTQPQKTIEKFYKKTTLYEYKDNSWNVSSSSNEKQIFLSNLNLMERVFEEAKKIEN